MGLFDISPATAVGYDPLQALGITSPAATSPYANDAGNSSTAGYDPWTQFINTGTQLSNRLLDSFGNGLINNLTKAQSENATLASGNPPAQPSQTAGVASLLNGSVVTLVLLGIGAVAVFMLLKD